MPAELDRCVEQLMNDPDFQPRGDRTKEQSAFAVCRTSLGLAKDGSEDKKILGLSDEQIVACLRLHPEFAKVRGGRVLYVMREADLDIRWDELLENGDARKRMPLIELGDDFKNAGQTFSVTLKDTKKAVANFEARGRAPIPVTIGHYGEEERQRAPAAAWIEDVFAGEDGRPWGLVRFLRETREAIEAGKFKYFSAEFYPEGVDQHGEKIGFELDGGAITNTPFFPTIRVDQARGGGPLLVSLSKFSGPAGGAGNGGTVADDVKGKDGKGQAGGDEKVQLTKAEHESLVKENASLKEKVQAMEKGGDDKVALAKRVEVVEADNKKLQRRILADEVRGLVRAAKAGGCSWKLGDFPLEKSDDEAIKALEEGALGGVTTIDGLRRCVKDEMYPKLEAGERTSSGSLGGSATPDLDTLEGRVAMVRKRVAEAKKEYGEELAFICARRTPKLSVWDWARRDLEAEHRGVKFPSEEESSGKSKDKDKKD